MSERISDERLAELIGCKAAYVAEAPEYHPVPAAEDQLSALRELQELRAERAWRPIETYDRDQHGYVVLVPGGMAYRNWGGWMSITGIDWPGRPIEGELKCFQPLPLPPAPQP